MVAFVALGRWQLAREELKRDQLEAAEAALALPSRQISAVAADQDATPAKVIGRGEFLATPRLLLDNQRRGQQVGVQLYCAFQPEGGPPLLVDLGWLPMPGDRELPDAPCPIGRHALAGMLVPPPAVGLRMGPGLAPQGESGWLATRIELPAVAEAWQLPALAPRVLRLDPALALGHERDLDLHANTLPPEKHRGYAIQWFGLAAAMLAIIVILNLRRKP